MRDETKRTCRRTGGPPPARGTHAAGRAQPSRHRPARRRIELLGAPVEADVRTGGQRGTAGQAAPGSRAKTHPGAEKALGAGSAERPRGARVCHRTMDGRANRAGDPRAIWRAVPQGSHRAVTALLRLASQEVRAEGPRARRGNHRPLVGEGAAAHQKRSPAVRPTLVPPPSPDPATSPGPSLESRSAPTLARHAASVGLARQGRRPFRSRLKLNLPGHKEGK
jgi:hypothetical protein